MGNREFIPQHGVYEDWNVYKLSLIILDITNYFANTYLDRPHHRADGTGRPQW